MRMKTNISISLFLTTFLLTTSPALGAANATDYNVVEIWKLGGHRETIRSSDSMPEPRLLKLRVLYADVRGNHSNLTPRSAVT